MPPLPWTTVDPDATGEVVVMASYFRLHRLSQVPRFLLDSMRILRQVRRTPGAVGIALEALPLRREFRTLSAWRDRASLDAMVGAEPHRSTMGRHRAAMADSRFTFWTAPAADLPVSWDEARRRLVPAE